VRYANIDICLVPRRDEGQRSKRRASIESPWLVGQQGRSVNTIRHRQDDRHLYGLDNVNKKG